jgi:hypothetical protein
VNAPEELKTGPAEPVPAEHKLLSWVKKTRARFRALPALVRRAVYVGLVLVLALALVMGISIVRAPKAHANPLLVAATPALAASGPPGWIAAGAMLGLVMVAEGIRRDAEDGEMFWEGAGDRWRDLIEGTKRGFDNSSDDEPSNPPDPAPADVFKADASYRLDNFRDTTSKSPSSTDPKRQLSFDVFKDTDMARSYDNIALWGHVHKQCRKPDGSVVPEIGSEVLGEDRNPFGDMPKWGPDDGNRSVIKSMACASNNDLLLSVVINPMTNADWALTPSTRARDGHGGYKDFTLARPSTYYFKDAWDGSTGFKNTITCKSPDGETQVVAGVSRDSEGMKVPQCPEGWTVEDFKTERVGPDDKPIGPPIAEGDVTGSKPVGIVVDGVACTMGREECANWATIAATQPERVQCMSEGRVIHLSHCNILERYYQNGGTPIVPENIDGDPNTYYDPWSDPSWTGVAPKQDGSYAVSPARPSSPPAPYYPKGDTMTPVKPWNPYTDPSSPVYDPGYDPEEDPEPDWEVPDTIPPDWQPSPSTSPSQPSEPEPTMTIDPSWDPETDPNDPRNPTPSPSAPEPTQEPSSDPEPTQEPTQDPEPTQEPSSDPEPTQEPSSDPEPSTDPEEDPDPDPSAEPTPDTSPSPQPDPTLDPVDPETLTKLDMDEDGHLLPAPFAVQTLTLAPDGSRVYTAPETGVQTKVAPDGTKTTTDLDVPGAETIETPEGTKTTTVPPKTPGAPPITYTTPPKIRDVPGTGINPIPPRLDAPPRVCVISPNSTDPRCREDDDDDEANCISDSWKFNPVDFVYEPVTCALFYAFDPEDEVLDYVKNKTREDLADTGIETALAAYRDSVDDFPDDGCSGPGVDMDAIGMGTIHPFDACGRYAPIAATVSAGFSFLTVAAGGYAMIRNVARGFGYDMPEVGEK